MHSLRLMERIAVCIKMNEPVLLVGETGNGKTTVIQYLAHQLRHELVVLVKFLILEVLIKLES